MRKFLSVPLVLLLALPLTPATAPTKVGGQPPPTPGPVTPAYLKLPATLNAKANRYFCLRPDTNCKSVKWLLPAGLDKIDPEIQLKDPTVMVLIGDTGTYTVQAYGALGDVATDLATCVVTIGAPPGPTPGPTPPTPTDPFTAAVLAAYSQEPATTRATDTASWASVFSAAVGHVDSPAVVTNSDLLSDLKVALASTRAGALPKVKAVLAAEMNAAWGNSPTAPLDKTAAKTELNKISTALGGLK